MSKGYWVFRDIEDKLGVKRERQLAKSPDNLGKLLRFLRPKSGDKIIITPYVLNKENHFEFVSVYENPGRKKRAVERYMFLSLCEMPVKEALPVILLAKDLEQCVSEEEKTLWLRAASPVVDSARLLSRSDTGLGARTEITHPYLEKHRRRIIAQAEAAGIDYTQYALCKDSSIIHPEKSSSALQLLVATVISSIQN